MDVHDCKEKGFLISGQVILSMPGHPCMRCCGFITDERLKQEAERYGAAGARPQVVWPNGVLASTAAAGTVDALGSRQPICQRILSQTHQAIPDDAIDEPEGKLLG